MDGVLADFHQGVCDLWGVNLERSQLPKPWPYAIEQNITELFCKPDKKITASQMWKVINEKSTEQDFWFNLKPYPWAHELYRICLHYGSEVIISTSPGYHHGAWSAKIRWLQHHLGHHAKDVMMGPRKELLAAPNHLLIDDSQENCDMFRAAWGKAIVFPQFWNNNYTLVPNRLEHVEHYLKHIWKPH